jgi:hypothetical protein
MQLATNFLGVSEKTHHIDTVFMSASRSGEYVDGAGVEIGRVLRVRHVGF